MHFFVFISSTTFFLKAFTNPLPLDSAESEPYLLALVDPEIAIATSSNPFISGNLQRPSFSSVEVKSIPSSQYVSTIDPSEPVASTDLAAVPCGTEEISGAFAAQTDTGMCSVESPNDGSKQQNNAPGKGGEPEEAGPAVPNLLRHSDSENICDPTSVFNQHYCCDGPMEEATKAVTQYAGQFCYYLIPYCIPGEF